MGLLSLTETKKSLSPKSSERISALAQSLLIRPESAIWDIGCDHGLVGLHALLAGKCKQLHLVDPVLANPQAAWAKHFQRHFPKEKRPVLHIHPVQAQDLNIVPELGDQVIIAGMGAREMQKIFESFMQKGVNVGGLIWVISCQSEKLKIRRFLMGLNLKFQVEFKVLDRERMFEIWQLGE